MQSDSYQEEESQDGDRQDPPSLTLLSLGQLGQGLHSAIKIHLTCRFLRYEDDLKKTRMNIIQLQIEW